MSNALKGFHSKIIFENTSVHCVVSRLFQMAVWTDVKLRELFKNLIFSKLSVEVTKKIGKFIDVVVVTLILTKFD